MAWWGGAVAICVGMAAAAPVWADQELALTIRGHRFEPTEVRAKAGSPIVLKVTNADATPEEFESTALNREKLVRGGGTITIRLPALKPGVYEFFGEFNPKTATGRLVIE
ncbi:MAG: cupredoxin domain-containing protein [Nitrospirae bacterium]|nr:cupredoxin domain-containing protein [Nitrospirota bacterium]